MQPMGPYDHCGSGAHIPPRPWHGTHKLGKFDQFCHHELENGAVAAPRQVPKECVRSRNGQTHVCASCPQHAHARHCAGVCHANRIYWGFSSVVERPLCMRKARGSNPLTSILMYLFFFRAGARRCREGEGEEIVTISPQSGHANHRTRVRATTYHLTPTSSTTTDPPHHLARPHSYTSTRHVTMNQPVWQPR